MWMHVYFPISNILTTSADPELKESVTQYLIQK